MLLSSRTQHSKANFAAITLSLSVDKHNEDKHENQQLAFYPLQPTTSTSELAASLLRLSVSLW